MRNNVIVREVEVSELLSEEVDLVITNEQEGPQENSFHAAKKSPKVTKRVNMSSPKRKEETTNSPKSELFNSFFRAT
jgi:hypothetical protein